MKPKVRITSIVALVCTLVAIGVLLPPKPASAAEFTHGRWTMTVYFNIPETAAFGAGGGVALSQCTKLAAIPAIGVVLVPICFAEAALITIQAGHALGSGMCLKLKAVIANPALHWWDVYRGSRCHN